jgi:tetratricopeptide (TPR) repeat protein
MSDAELARQMTQLTDAQLVEAQTADEYAFRHALTREAVYGTLLVRERRRYHQAIAEALEQSHAPALDAHIPALAYHYYEAGAWAKALDYAQRAGAKAQAMFAPREAIQNFSRAIESAAQLGRPVPAALHRARGQAYDTSGDFEHARIDYETALGAARAASDRPAEWQALFDLGFLWASRDYTRTGNYLQQALAQARAMGDPAILARSLNRLGNWYANIEQPAVSVEYHREALGIFEALHDKPGLATTLDLLGLASTFLGDLVSGAEYFGRAVALFRELDDRAGLASALSNYAESGVAYYVQLMVATPVANAEARQYIAEAHVIAREIGWRPGEAYALVNRGGLLCSSGEYAEGIANAQAGLALAREIEHEQWQAFACMMLGMVYTDLMAFDKARAYLERGLALARAVASLNFERSLAGQLVFLATLHGSARERARALAELDVAMRDGSRSEALPPPGEPLTMGQRICWLARGAALTKAGKPRPALQIVERIDQAPPVAAIAAKHPPLSAVLGRAEALWRCTGKGAPAARPGAEELESAIAQVKQALARMIVQESPQVRWRLHLALGRLYRAQHRHADARREFTSAREIVAQLAERIGDEAVKRNYLMWTAKLIPAGKKPITQSHKGTLRHKVAKTQRKT